MKSKVLPNYKNFFKYVFACLSLLLFTFCQNVTDEIILTKGELINKDSKVVSLMIAAVKSNTNKTFAKSDDDNQCTDFLYPMTFDVFPGDDNVSFEMTINSDQELIDFLTTLTTTYEYYVNWPLTLIDVDGNELNIYSLVELEGTLEVIVDACNADSEDDDDGDDNSDDNDDSEDGDDNGNDYDYCHDNNKKVYICHKGITICVSINAIWGHLAQHQEDYLGQCN